MAISIGFFKYVYNWITDQETASPIYRPFETDENPYKARVFIVGAHPTPTLTIPTDAIQSYANALVNRAEYLALFPDYYSTTSREVKGAIRFSDYLRSEYNINSAVSYVNALTAMNLTDLKNNKKLNPNQYSRGQSIFKEVVEEIKPPIILLHGQFALDEFRKNFEDYYIEFGHPFRTLSELDGAGVIGKIIHDNGEETKIFATKSLTFFKENDEGFDKVIMQICEA